MVLTRQEKEKLVLDLHNQRQPIRVIAKEAGMSFRDIGPIIDKEEKDKEAKEAQVRQGVVSSQAYKLFSASKTPVQVAVELNLGQLEVMRLYREYWNLVQLDNLNKIYKEVADDIWFFVELYKLAKATGMEGEHVLKLLKIANNDLRSVELRYENVKERIKSLEEQKHNSERKLVELNNQITESSNYLDYYRASCRQEDTKLEGLRQKRVKLEALVTQFEKDSPEYGKIIKSLEACVSDRKGLLVLALLCLTQSIRNDPEKYSSLIYYGAPSTRRFNHPYYGTSYIHRQQPSQSKNCGSEDYMAMLVEEADKLCIEVPKELIDKITTDYSTCSGTYRSWPSLPPPDED